MKQSALHYPQGGDGLNAEVVTCKMWSMTVKADYYPLITTRNKAVYATGE